MLFVHTLIQIRQHLKKKSATLSYAFHCRLYLLAITGRLSIVVCDLPSDCNDGV